MNQIREALAAWFLALSLPSSARKQVLEHAAWTISYTRHHNTEAHIGHRKKTLLALQRRGLALDEMRTCVESNFAL